MTPILFDAKAQSFDTNGLGRLSEATECTVTEERNGQYELEMVFPITGRLYSQITRDRIIAARASDSSGIQAFRIYYISKPIDGKIIIDAHHISYDLSKIPAAPFSASSCADALAGFRANAVENCPFTFGTDKTTSGNFSLRTPASIRSRLVGVEGSILDVFGTGEYEFDNFSVYLHLHRGHDTGITLRYGKDITYLIDEENDEDSYTGIYPYYDNGETVVTLPEKILHSAHTVDYAVPRTVALDLSTSFDDVPTVDQLRSKAQSYMDSNEGWNVKHNLTVSFVDLSQTEEYKNVAPLQHVKLCDTVNVVYEKLGVNASLKVTKTTWNVLQDRYDSIELGDGKSDIADVVGDTISGSIISSTKSYTEASVRSATQQITGNKGGYVVIYDSDGDKCPDEILVMDQPTKETAKKVWRWNKAGLGYSSGGYNGTYGLAITQDGAIVADYVSTGKLNAGIISAGTLKDSAGNTEWNLETGELISKQFQLTTDNLKIASDGKITATALAFDNGKFKVTADGDVTASSFALTSSNLKIASDGTLTAANANISGTITSSNSESGNVKISNGTIYFTNTGNYISSGYGISIVSNQGIYLQSPRIYLGSSKTLAQTHTFNNLMQYTSSESVTVMSSWSLNQYTIPNLVIKSSSASSGYTLSSDWHATKFYAFSAQPTSKTIDIPSYSKQALQFTYGILASSQD